MPFKLKKQTKKHCFFRQCQGHLNYFGPYLKVLEYLSLTSYVYLYGFASYLGNMLHTILSLQEYDYIPK